MCMCLCYASRRRDTSCELVTGVKKCALPISKENTILASARRYAERGGHPRLPDTELTHCWLKKHRYAIHAIALARRFRPVIEHMPQMPAAPAAMDFHARMTKKMICAGLHRLGKRSPEAGPARSAFEFCTGRKQG